jgi:transposase
MGIPEIVKRNVGMAATERSEGERSETERSGGAAMPLATDVADPEVSTKAVRRQFSASYKRRILDEADHRCGRGEVAALLRREGLFSSHLTAWRKQRMTGEIAGLEPHKRGKKPIPRNPLTAENEQLRRENVKLKKRLHQAEAIVAVQKKLCDLLGLTVPPVDISESDE